MFIEAYSVWEVDHYRFKIKLLGKKISAGLLHSDVIRRLSHQLLSLHVLSNNQDKVGQGGTVIFNAVTTAAKDGS